MTKFLLILSFTISNLELLLCKFQNYHDPTDARRVTVFSDSSLRKSFLKANLMCNACNGFLVSHSIQCTAVNGTCNVTESDRIWRGTYFRKLGDGIGQQSLVEATLNGTSTAFLIGLRNALFLLDTPCLVTSNGSTNLEQRPCEQKRPFSCQYASYTTKNLVGLRDSAFCKVTDFCFTPIDKPVAKIGCPYYAGFKSRIQFQSFPGARIINGEVAPLTNHPWAVRLIIKSSVGDSHCGASIISPQHVITASHCFNGMKEAQLHYAAPVGTHIITFNESYIRKTASCDVALVTLPESLVFSQYAMPIKLPGPTDHPELLEWVQTIGWGSFCDKRTDPLCLQGDEADRQHRASESLRSVFIQTTVCPPRTDLEMVKEKCAPKMLICAGGMMHDIGVDQNPTQVYPADACNGDSGGALECYNQKGEVYLCGIVESGPDRPKCGTSPGKYINMHSPEITAFLAPVQPAIQLEIRTDWFDKHLNREFRVIVKSGANIIKCHQLFLGVLFVLAAVLIC